MRHEDERTALVLGHKHCAHSDLAYGEGCTQISLLLGKMQCAKAGLSHVGKGEEEQRVAKEREGITGYPWRGVQLDPFSRCSPKGKSWGCPPLAGVRVESVFGE